MTNCSFNFQAFFAVHSHLSDPINIKRDNSDTISGLLSFLRGPENGYIIEDKDLLTFKKIFEYLPTEFRSLSKHVKGLDSFDTLISEGTGGKSGDEPAKDISEIVSLPTTSLDFDKITDINIARDYFGNNGAVYSKFLKKFQRGLLQMSIVDFKNGNLIHNNQELTNNILGYRNELVQSLQKFTNTTDINSAITEGKLFFKKYQNGGNIGKVLENIEEFNAYNAFLLLNSNLDMVLQNPGISLGIITLKKNLVGKYNDGNETLDLSYKYNVVNDQHFLHMFGRENTNILDESNKLAKTLISLTPIIKKVGRNYIESDQYLDVNHTMTIVNEIKNSIRINNFRLKGEAGYEELFRKALETTTSDVNEPKKEIIRSLYNYFFHNPETLKSDIVKKQMISVKSLNVIFHNETTNLKYFSNAPIIELVSSLLDKTVTNNYRGLVYDKKLKDFVTQESKTKLVNGTTQKLIKNFSNKVKYVKLDGIEKYIETSGNNKGNLIESMFPTLPDTITLSNLESVRSATKVIDDILKTNLSSNDMDFLRTSISHEKNVSNLLKDFLDLSKKAVLNNYQFHFDEVKPPRNYNIVEYEESIEGTPPFTAGLHVYSEIYNKIMGIESKAVIKNLSGNSVPVNSLLSVISDDVTSLEQIRQHLDNHEQTFGKEALINTPIFHNLFGRTSKTISLDNKNIIKGTYAREGIMGFDGKVIDPTKASAADIANISILGDFYGNYVESNGKEVGLQPVTYADKSQQKIKVFNTEFNVKGFNNVDGKLNSLNIDQIKDLHKQSVGGQYVTLHNKVVDDMQTILRSIVSETPDYFAKSFREKNPILELALDKIGVLKPEFISNRNIKLVNTLNKYLNLDVTKLKTLESMDNIMPLLKEEHIINHGLKNGITVTLENHYSKVKGELRSNYQIIREFNTYTKEGAYEQRMNTAQNKFIRDLVDEDVLLFAKNPITNTDYLTIQKAAKLVASKYGYTDETWLNDWIDTKGTLIHAKINGKNIAPSDLAEDNVRNGSVKLEVNPLLEHYFWMHNLLSTNYTLAIGGGVHAHEVKSGLPDVVGGKENPLFWEGVTSSRTTASDKRNVLYQATIHPFYQNTVRGLPSHILTSVVKDLEANMFNYMGTQDGFKFMDGCALWTPIGMILAHDSTKNATEDIFVQKLIHHSYDPNYLTATLEKYATYGITNEFVRYSKNAPITGKNLLQKMMSMEVTGGINFFGEYFSNKMTPIEGNEEFSTINGLPKEIAYIDNGNLIKINGFKSENNKLTISRDIIDHNGSLIKKETISEDHPKNLFELWQLFGGEYSVEKDDNGIFNFGQNYKYTEASNHNTAHIVVEYSKELPTSSKMTVASDYDQPLKQSFIYQVNNTSGIKNGAININDSSKWINKHDINDSNTQLNHYPISTIHWGVQGSFGHEFSEEAEAHVSEITQVMSGAAANGNEHEKVYKLYQNIANVVKFSIKKYTNAIKNDKIVDLLVNELYKELSSKDKLGFGQLYLEKVREAALKAKLGSELEAILPAFSDNNLYPAMISMVSSAMNRLGIKRKYPGGANVIQPGHNMFMVYEDSEGNIIDGSKFNENDHVIESHILYNEVKMYDHIKIDGKDYILDSPQKYYDFKHDFERLLIKLGSLLLPKVAKINIDVIKGGPRNLKNGSYTFIHPITSEELNMYDLQSTKASYAINPFIKLINRNLNIDTTSTELSKGEIKLNTDAKTSSNKNINNFLKTEQGKLLKNIIINLKPDLDFKNFKDITKVLKSKEFVTKLTNVIQQEQNLLYKGIFTDLEGKQVLVNVTKQLGEVKLPNINKYKFGLEEGITIDNINLNYFKKKLLMLKSSDFQYTDIYFQNLKGESFHTLSTESFNDIKNKSGMKIDKITPKIEMIEDNDPRYDDVTVGRYAIKDDGSLDHLLPEGTDIYNIAGRKVLVYDNIDNLQKIVENNTFKYSKNNYNFETGNFDKIKEYINKYDEKNNNIVSKNKITANKKWSYYQTENIDKDALKINQSWQKQLEVIATRIPAQTLQSFAGMKIVSFFDSNLNYAILPAHKNWTDGSDFDIDKVYILGFGVDHTGKIVHWSRNYMNYGDIALSLTDLPIPRGEALINTNKATYTVPVEDSNNIENYMSMPSTMEGRYGPEGIKLFKSVTKTLTDIAANDSNEINTSEKAFDFLSSYMKMKPSEKELLEGSKNSVAQGLINISSSIKNVLASSRPVDMNDPRDAAKSSSKGKSAMEIERENPMSIIKQIIENNAGKQVIGISAVGLKSLFNYSTLVNQKIKNLEKLVETKGESYVLEQLQKISSKFRLRNGNELTIPNFIANSNFENSPKVKKIYQEQFLENLIPTIKLNSNIGLPEFNYTEYVDNWKTTVQKAIENKDDDELIQLSGPKMLINAFIQEKGKESNIDIKILAKQLGVKLNENIVDQIVNKLSYPEKGMGEPSITYSSIEAMAIFNNKIMAKGDKVKVLDVTSMEDMSISMSALLSAATDNAKELILSKINAGPELAGVYLYMMLNGTPFSEIAKFMTSPIIDQVVKFGKSNVLNPFHKFTNTLSAAEMFSNGPEIKNFFNYEYRNPITTYLNEHNIFNMSRVELEEFSQNHKFIEGANAIEAEVKSKNKGMYEDDYYSDEDYSDNTYNYYENDGEENNGIYKPKISRNLAFFMHDLIKYKRAIEDIKLDNENFNEAELRFKDVVNSFIIYKEQADEARVLGGRAGINQGIKTKFEEKYNFDYNINSFLGKRFGSLYKEDFQPLIDNKFISQEDIDNGNYLRKVSDIQKIHKAIDENPMLKQHFIDLYDKVKSSFNLIEAEFDIPHFKAMHNTNYVVDDAFNQASFRYSTLNEIMTQLIDTNLVAKKDGWKRYDPRTLKTLSNQLLAFSVDKFFEDRQLSFNIPEGFEKITSKNGSTHEYEYQKSNGEKINIDNISNKATFKKYFETEIVPFLQNDDVNITESIDEPSNTFVKSLIFDETKGPIIGQSYAYYKCDFPFSEAKDDPTKTNLNISNQFNDLKLSFNKTIGLTKDGNNIGDMIMIYNLLLHNNSFGNNTFTKLIESSDLSRHENAIWEQFMNYVGELDRNPLRIKIDLETFALRAAEALKSGETHDSIGPFKDTYIKEYDRDTQMFKIYKKNEDNNYEEVSNFDIDDNFSNFVIENFMKFEGSEKLNIPIVRTNDYVKTIEDLLENKKLMIFKVC